MENRPIARKWLTANGLSSAFVCDLKLREIAEAYNDVSGATLERLHKQAANVHTPTTSAPTATADEPASAPVLPVMITPNEPKDDDADAALAEAVRVIAARVQPKAASIDDAAVVAIIKRELPGLVPVTRIEIVKPNDEPLYVGTMPMHHKFPLLVKALACGLHVFLSGPAGSGKTTAAEMAATAVQKLFRIEGAVSGEHKLTGFVDAHGKYHSTPYRDAFQSGHVFVKDEIDADDPAALLTLNAGMANGYAAFPDCVEPIMKGAGFQCVACANTWGNGADRIYVGRNQLDGATLDRFVFIDWDYDEKLEAALCDNASWLKRVQSLRHAAFAEKARIVISPRASIFGAKLLAAGVPSNDVESMCIWKGLDSEVRSRIEARAR